MEEREFKSTYRDVNPRECPFERAMLRQCSACSHAVRLSIAEREAVGCRTDEAHGRCIQLMEALQHNVRFALRIDHPDAPLPHGKRIKIECGGLLGLQKVMAEEHQRELAPEPRVEDAHGVIEESVERFGSIDAIPFQRLMPAIAHFEGRRRRR